MSLAAIPATDTRTFFRPVGRELIALLRGLGAGQWQRPTVAGTWVVRDVVAHLVDLTFRRLSFHRDGLVPPPPPRPITSERDFVDFINWLNSEWVAASRRFSPQVLTDLFEQANADLADFFEALPLEAPALFGVSWAGEQTSEGWFDIGREFTELWHHQEQIRMAVNAPPLQDSRYLQAVLEISIRGLPHAYRGVPGVEADSVVVDVSGASGGAWTLLRQNGVWTIWAGAVANASARVHLSDQAAWRLLFNALPPAEAAKALRVDGRLDLASPLMSARSIVV